MSNSGNHTPVYQHVGVPQQDQFPTLVVNLGQDIAPLPPAISNPPTPPDADGEIDVVEKVKFALRGRWVLAIVLAAVLGPVAAYFGYGFKPITYKSEGTVQVPYLRPKVLQGNDADTPMVLFDSVLTAQAQRIKGRAIVDAALATPEWRKTGRGNAERTAIDFSVHVAGEHPLTTELIKISFVDRDPTVAAAGVNAVIRAFSATYAKELEDLDQEKMEQLEVRRQDLTSDLEHLESQMEAEMPPLTNPAAAIFPSPATSPRSPSVATSNQQESAPVTLEQLGPETFKKIAQSDQVMREYLYQQEQMQDVLAQLKDVYGDKHPEVIRKTRELDRFTDKIYQYAAQYRPPAPTPAPAAQSPAPAPATVVAPSTEPTIAQVQMSPRYESLKNDARTVRDELNEIIRRMETLRMEGNVGQRVAVISHGEVPVAPFSDTRLKMAAVFGAAGAAFPVGLLILLGLLGRTYRFSMDAEDTASDSVPLLGILPILTEGCDENEKRADAAHCVHQIRAILQMRRPMQTAYMITSAAAGEGKTSLTAALAFAFAAAGSKTLIIDADLVGQRLTGGFKCDRHLGLHDMMTGSSFADCFTRIDHNLRFMPVGKTDTTLAAWTLASASVRNVIIDAKRYFDVVLVDTGPVLGSVEASVVAPEVDGVIFTIARGQERWLVEKATKHLRSVGGHLMGFVFNRAESRDFNRSAFRSSARSSTMPQEPDWSPKREAPQAQRLGPLVVSVATLLPASAGASAENTAAKSSGNGARATAGSNGNGHA